VVEEPHRGGLGKLVLPSHEAKETVLKYFVFYEINRYILTQHQLSLKKKLINKVVLGNKVLK
jgi:hypothetical protein